MSLNTQSIEKKQNRHNAQYYGRDFWQFHIAFWGISAFVMFLSGLSQEMGFEIALVRNVLYGVLGFLFTFLFISVFDRFQNKKTLNILLICIILSYLIGTLTTLLINPISASQSGFILWQESWTSWFSGSLNFTLVTLLWCSFYLAFKHGLQFLNGEEAEKVAHAISSMSSVSTFSEFMALERNKKLFLLPVENICVVQGAGDYLEIITDEGNFLKRESLNNMVDMLDPKIFQRVHRSVIVNLHAIDKFEPKGKGDYTLILKSGLHMPASRSYMKNVKSQF